MPPKKYATFGSTTISVPSKMVGFDKKNKPHLWNTTTPITHRLSYHNNKLAINLAINPNTTRKIQKVPRTTKYMSYENKNVSNGGGGANGQLFISPVSMIQPRTIPPPPIPVPIPVTIPINTITRDEAASKIQSIIRRRQTKVNLPNQEEASIIANAIRNKLAKKQLDKLRKKKKVDDALKKYGISSLSGYNNFTDPKILEQQKILEQERIRIAERDSLILQKANEEKERQKQIKIENENRRRQRDNAVKVLQRFYKNKQLFKEPKSTSVLQVEPQLSLSVKQPKEAAVQIANAYKIYKIKRKFKQEKAKKIQQSLITSSSLVSNREINETKLLLDRKKIQDEEQAALKRIQKILETEKKQKIIKEVSASGKKTKALKTIQKFFRSKKNYTRQELDIMSIQEIERLLKYAPDGSIIAPIRNITSQRDRDIFNAWQRKNRR